MKTWAPDVIAFRAMADDRRNRKDQPRPLPFAVEKKGMEERKKKGGKKKKKEG